MYHAPNTNGQYVPPYTPPWYPGKTEPKRGKCPTCGRCLDCGGHYCPGPYRPPYQWSYPRPYWQWDSPYTITYNTLDSTKVNQVNY